jgi:hypothetical protein
MDYRKYDYKNVNTELKLSNYEKFVSNNRCYKFYLFDMFLSQYDLEQNAKTRSLSKKYSNIQKVLLFTPYIIIGSVVSVKSYQGFFSTKVYYKEKELFKRLFMFMLIWRVFHKMALKYQGDMLMIKNSKTEEVLISN